MKESRKEFIKKAHSAACSEWKENIEKEFPKLFKEDALVVGKWYKSEGCLFNYQKQSNVYGFFTDGSWMNGDWIWYGANAKPATDKEVEEALIKEAKKRGFKEGIEFKSVSRGNSIERGYDVFGYYSNQNQLCNGGGSVFIGGKWAEIIKETITKEQAEKELGKTILT